MGAVIHRSFLRRIACVSLLTQGVAALCFHGLTLCVGADGHTAIAWMAADDCCLQTQTTAVRPDDGCDCTDGLLLQPIAERRAGGDELARSSASLAPNWSFFPAAPQTAPPAAYALPPPGSLIARHSVVLQA